MEKIKVKVFSCFLAYIHEAASCDPDNCSESQLLYVEKIKQKQRSNSEIDLCQLGRNVDVAFRTKLRISVFKETSRKETVHLFFSLERRRPIKFSKPVLHVQKLESTD
jgi:hypothetical protein